MKTTKCYSPSAATSPSAVAVCLSKAMQSLEATVMFLQTVDPSTLPEGAHAELLAATAELGIQVRLAQTNAPQVRRRG